MKKYQVNMVHPQQIVQKGLKGCRTTRTVTAFAQKTGVPYVWWKPTTNQKVMLVDWTQFRQAWTRYGENWTTRNFTYPQTGYRTWTKPQSCASTTRTPRRTATTRTNRYSGRTQTKTNRRSTYSSRRRAA